MTANPSVRLVPEPRTEDERRREQWNEEAADHLARIDSRLNALDAERNVCTDQFRLEAIDVETDELEERSDQLWIDVLVDWISRMENRLSGRAPKKRRPRP